METRASVVIIGAGIVGSAAAHFLSDLGWRDVVVVDQGPLFATGGSTSHAPGLVFQTNGSKTMTQFARETVELFASLEHDGQPCWYGVGSLEVATTPARWADLHRKLGWARSWGIDASLLTPAETSAKLDLIDESVILGAYYVPTDGVAKPVWAAEALARATRGVTFHAENGRRRHRNRARAGASRGHHQRPHRNRAGPGLLRHLGTAHRPHGRRADPAGAGRTPARVDHAAARACRRDR